MSHVTPGNDAVTMAVLALQAKGWSVVTADSAMVELAHPAAETNIVVEFGGPNECGAAFSTGGYDPYGSACELPAGHEGQHRGPDPFGTGGHVAWSGGGSAGGDPLPYRDVTFCTE